MKRLVWDCQGDTTGWPTPDPVLEWDSEDGVKLRQPQRLGKRVAKLLEVGTGLADAWQTMDEEVRSIAESVLGPMPEPTMDDLPGREAVVYAARDADATLRVWNQLAPRLASEGLEEAFELDRGILPIVSAMMGTGMGVDMDKLAALDTDLGRMMDEAEAVLSYTTGFDCNPGSGDQVADLLYRRLGAPPLGKPTTSGRPSTANKALESIRMACQRNDRTTGAIDLILTYRHAAKLRGTYARLLRRKARWRKEWGSWRVYTKINTTRTDTGRLASADPNLQNIPARSDLGKRVREAFVASPGMRLGAWDYDQIEMRVLAAEFWRIAPRSSVS